MRAIDVAALLAELRADHPAVDVHIRHAAGGSREMALHVREGRLDLAFVAVSGGEVPGVELIHLAREPIVLVAPATHPLAKPRHYRRSAPRPRRSSLKDGASAQRTTGPSRPPELTRTITYEVNDTASLIDFVRHGLAVAMMPPSLVDDRDGLALIPIRDHPTEFVTAVATPSNRRLSAAARALLETIERHVSS